MSGAGILFRRRPGELISSAGGEPIHSVGPPGPSQQGSGHLGSARGCLRLQDGRRRSTDRHGGRMPYPTRCGQRPPPGHRSPAERGTFIVRAEGAFHGPVAQMHVEPMGNVARDDRHRLPDNVALPGQPVARRCCAPGGEPEPATHVAEVGIATPGCYAPGVQNQEAAKEKMLRSRRRPGTENAPPDVGDAAPGCCASGVRHQEAAKKQMLRSKHRTECRGCCASWQSQGTAACGGGTRGGQMRAEKCCAKTSLRGTVVDARRVTAMAYSMVHVAKNVAPAQCPRRNTLSGQYFRPMARSAQCRAGCGTPLRPRGTVQDRGGGRTQAEKYVARKCPAAAGAWTQDVSRQWLTAWCTSRKMLRRHGVLDAMLCRACTSARWHD
jgi:hypothetical protein